MDALALDGRDVPLMIEPHFDEVRAGTYGGAPGDTYWAWEQQHSTRAAAGLEAIGRGLLPQPG
jgi:hypothetical protein